MTPTSTERHDDQAAGVAAAKAAPPQSLTARAYATLRQDIISCQLPPGLEVFEHELSERLGMSKTPVREALVRLCSEGLVEAFPRRAYRIAPVTIAAINDLFGVRAALEGSAAAAAAARMGASELDALQLLADASYQVGEPKSRHEFVDANRAFHLAISGAAGNARLHGLVVGHIDEGERLLHIGARARDVNAETNREHHHLVEVLRRGDAEQARLLMVAHIESTRKGLLASLLSSAVDAAPAALDLGR